MCGVLTINLLLEGVAQGVAEKNMGGFSNGSVAECLVKS